MIPVWINEFKRSLKSIKQTEFNRGATALEYAIMLALVAGVIVAAVSSFGGAVRGLFETASRGW